MCSPINATVVMPKKGICLIETSGAIANGNHNKIRGIFFISLLRIKLKILISKTAAQIGPKPCSNSIGCHSETSGCGYEHKYKTLAGKLMPYGFARVRKQQIIEIAHNKILLLLESSFRLRAV